MELTDKLQLVILILEQFLFLAGGYQRRYSESGRSLEWDCSHRDGQEISGARQWG